MTPTLVDSNVVLDVADDPEWKNWSTAAIRRCLDEIVLVINPIIFAEVSIGYRTVDRSKRSFRLISTIGSRCPTMPHFSLENASWPIVGGAEHEPRRCRTSISAPTQPCAAIDC